MVNKQLRPAASFLLFLNLCMYGVVLGLSGWAMNRIINYGTVGGGQNGATLYLIIFSLVAGVVGAVSCLFGLNHVTYWGPDSLPAAAVAAAIAWGLTVLALGFASKHIRLHTDSEHLKALEAFIIILSGTMLLYIGAIHGAIKRG
ncbi:membrane protein PM19L-like [Amaranthus tricolor]|uniref:membrane protein PM19L-like n=1 Tax=Amaranthus tricolor TaxID=29722 RepID=UPI0025832D45|nr:membrane protein PM19L-like [Amaranthus tricolor]XP_057537625.1 membrane protein PM19L-like [Amaranthus tricolor]